MVTGVYQNSANIIYFNNNGTVTRGWEQDHKNRESRYPDVTKVKLDMRDVRVELLGTTGAYVSCLWTQTQEYKGTPESASGRMTIVFKKVGKDWKAVHLHTSPDRPDTTRPVFPSERSPEPSK
jgi:ketosteroid isomerase-like protein